MILVNFKIVYFKFIQLYSQYPHNITIIDCDKTNDMGQYNDKISSPFVNL
jgi:hypothetical protein